MPILSTTPLTHNVRQIRIQRPEGYQFHPGQATEVSINQEGWREERRPFTFTSLAEEPYLEFVIKSYRDHAGVTNKIDTLRAGDELMIHDVWGAIAYKGEGYFIAGGAGITPFIAILRQLKKEKQLGSNHLFFSNRTHADIILKEELSAMLGDHAHFIVTGEPAEAQRSIRIDEAFLKEQVPDFSRHFYICGPDAMVAQLSDTLVRLGAKPDAVVFEK